MAATANVPSLRPAALPAALGAGLERRLVETLGFRLALVEELDPGVAHNNRIFRLRGQDGRLAALKVYQRDDRQRLEREHAMLAFLHRRRFEGVPVPLLRSDTHDYGVYSFEPGATRPSGEWTAAHAAATGRLMARLHAIRPDEPGASFPPSFAATFSYADQVQGIRRRLARFTGYAAGRAGQGQAGRAGQGQAGREVAPEVRALLETCDPAQEVERLLREATRGLSAAELEARTPPELWRLSPGDPAPHNTLLREDGSVCLLDFEYSGWDEPATLPACFLTAETCLALPAALQEAFLDAYRQGVDLPAACLARLKRVSALMHVSWCTVHLQLLVPELIAKKQFATPTLDVAWHLQDQVAKLRHRLSLAEQVLGALSY